MEVKLEDVVAREYLPPKCAAAVPATAVTMGVTDLLASPTLGWVIPCRAFSAFGQMVFSILICQTDHFFQMALKVKSVMGVDVVRVWLTQSIVGLFRDGFIHSVTILG